MPARRMYGVKLLIIFKGFLRLMEKLKKIIDTTKKKKKKLLVKGFVDKLEKVEVQI